MTVTYEEVDLACPIMKARDLAMSKFPDSHLHSLHCLKVVQRMWAVTSFMSKSEESEELPPH